MVKRIPTQVGDVLILRTDQSFTIHVIGTVSKDGHQDFENQRMALQYQNDYAAAVANVTLGAQSWRDQHGRPLILELTSRTISSEPPEGPGSSQHSLRAISTCGSARPSSDEHV